MLNTSHTIFQKITFALFKIVLIFFYVVFVDLILPLPAERMKQGPREHVRDTIPKNETDTIMASRLLK